MKKLNKLKISLKNIADEEIVYIEDVKKEYEALFRTIFNVDHESANSFNMILSSGMFNLLG